MDKTIVDTIKETCPNGHEEFVPDMLGIIKLHSDKNYDYAHGGNSLGNFDRVSQILSIYPNLKANKNYVIALVYALKQIDQVLWSLNTGYEPKVEGRDKRMEDIVNYFALARIMLREEARQIKTDSDCKNFFVGNTSKGLTR